MKRAIVGIPGPRLAAEDIELLRRHPPAGVILFARNVQAPAQLRALTADLRDLLPVGAAIMVDQEGGRVARLRGPHWPEFPSAATLGPVWAQDPARGCDEAAARGRALGEMLAAEGFTMDAAPVLDLAHEGADTVVGDRAFSADPKAVAALGRAFAEGLKTGGITPIIKHIPGHGRAAVDSHKSLPIVTEPVQELAADFAPFRANTGLPWAMTAHVLYTAVDPDRPATLSPVVIERIIRGEIGFKGGLMSDDLAMGALTGTPAARALAAIEAGCDIALYCPGDPAGTASVLAAVPEIETDLEIPRA